MSEHMLVSKNESGCLSITLARPERRNAITVSMYAAMADAIERAGQDDEIRLITIEGAGDDFTAGNDLFDFLQAMPQPGSQADIPVWRFLRAMANNKVPVVAAVHGNAVGIGTTMLLHCDLVLVEQGARLVMPFVDLGLVPEAASSLIVPQLAGRRAAARYLLLGEPMGAEEALAAGIASHVVERGKLGETLDKVVAALLAKPKEALRQTQALLRQVSSDEILERMNLENGHFAERLASEEVKQAISTFFAARSAKG
ncbi:MAG: enoyl-CoA hydratase-related protein [Sphingomicrobium sp.]